MAVLDPNSLEKFFKIFPELPENHASVILLYAAGTSQKEIAELCNTTPSRVERQLHKAKALLGLHTVHAVRQVVLVRLLMK
ncbi:sigma factor-like helix-turn-helix DNA-binding protein [Aeromonas salmonicida]|jgi:RNA polymerase sigma factor (sigma-70 family)|uniref:sigma factor-like helix-turn-helix DNA-binding protein n=1 Tax=Aeromonas salmonicida TaxID=645 RepID=UPI000B400203|nr:sigma factor-like helix-turn-helix DNA-binding protein [Aeromonas salmonicida]ARW85339.1 hypothetical protein O23A_P3p0040 [Aeromonas salmonicida]